MNLFANVHELVLESLASLQSSRALPADLDFKNVTVEAPRDSSHGDMSTNAAMILAKQAKMRPREIADLLLKKLVSNTQIEHIEIAGPGFLNLTLSKSIWLEAIPQIVKLNKEFGRSSIGKEKRVNVEFVSANPTGPIHVGHTRGAVFGDALANLLDFAGYNVTREYYINDGGAQIDALARSVYLRYLEANGNSVEFIEGTYPGEYLIPVGESLKEGFGDVFVEADEAEWLPKFRAHAVRSMMELIESDLLSLGIKMDVFYSEKSLYGTGRIETALEELSAKGLIYEGYLDPPKGKLPEDWEPRKQTLFRSSEYGDDVDRPIKKSDGQWTYFAPDIAYHYDKISRKFDHLINIFGADHGGYVKRMKAAVRALSNDEITLDIKLTQLVRLYKNGEPFKMSKRAGNFISLRDLVEQVGSDVTRFVMLTRKNDAPLDFDFDKVLEQSRDNPVFYVQYAYARINSVLKKARVANINVCDGSLISADMQGVEHESEVYIIKKVCEWPRLVELAAKHNEPHRVAFYLYELASEFHAFWSKGKDTPSLRFIHEDNVMRSLSKLAVARSVAIVISNGLGILGVQPMDEMR
ncbi:MAG: arginine--tRNA ligase [Paracoccaceae bacterium]|nr:arginine--tRNA ligase [Paracoccaceae bacterium]